MSQISRMWLVLSVAVGGALGGCLVQGNARVVTPAPQPVAAQPEPAPAAAPVVQEEVVVEEPPAPQVYVAAVRPGFIFIDGHWEHPRGGRWVWREGYYEKERAGWVWEPGRWTVRGRGHVWVGGRWRHR